MSRLSSKELRELQDIYRREAKDLRDDAKKSNNDNIKKDLQAIAVQNDKDVKNLEKEIQRREASEEFLNKQQGGVKNSDGTWTFPQ